MAASGAVRRGHIPPSGEHPRTRVGSRFGTSLKRRLLVRTVQPWSCHLQDAAVLKASKGKPDKVHSQETHWGLAKYIESTSDGESPRATVLEA